MTAQNCRGHSQIPLSYQCNQSLPIYARIANLRQTQKTKTFAQNQRKIQIFLEKPSYICLQLLLEAYRSEA